MAHMTPKVEQMVQWKMPKMAYFVVDLIWMVLTMDS
jgi:hypothetical protein